MPKVVHFNYVSEQDGRSKKRLDHFLAVNLPDHSRSQVTRLIEQGHVQVNGKPVSKSGHFLASGDEIIVTLMPPRELKGRPQDIDLDIVADENDFIVINKPAGLLVHHAPTSRDEVSLVDGLLFHFNELKQFGDDLRPGIVHRLDKQTSGLVLVAKNQKAQQTLTDLFKNRLIKKTYLAVASGHPDREGCIEYPIGRHPRLRHKMSHRGIASREAITRYSVLSYADDTSLVAFFPVTGRTHQIRVHAAAIGHPIIGDVTYGSTSRLINRQALHAYKLSFTYQDIPHVYQAPLPQDFLDLLNKCDLPTDLRDFDDRL